MTGKKQLRNPSSNPSREVKKTNPLLKNPIRTETD